MRNEARKMSKIGVYLNNYYLSRKKNQSGRSMIDLKTCIDYYLDLN